MHLLLTYDPFLWYGKSFLSCDQDVQVVEANFLEFVLNTMLRSALLHDLTS